MKLKLSLAFIGLYILSLLLTAPASLITRFIPENSGVAINQISGTVWDGKIVGIDYRNQFQLKKITWKMDWLALLALKIKADVKFDNGRKVMSGIAAVSYGFSGVTVSDVDIDLKATELVSYLQLPIPITPSGKFNLLIEKATLGAPYCGELTGKLLWNNAVVDTPMGNVDLATPKVDLDCVEGALFAVLEQDSEQLTTKVDISLKTGGNYQLQGTLIGHEKLEPSLLQAIGMLGPKLKTGETPLTFKGQL